MEKDKWRAGYLEFLNFKEKYKSVHVPGGYVSFSGFRLGRWVHAQRELACAGTMPDEWKKLLQSQNFPFTRKTKFEAGVDETAAYVQTTGVPQAPAEFVAPSGFPLGRWQRTVLARAANGRLSSDQVAALSSVGLPAARVSSRDDFFSRGIAESQAYLALAGVVSAPRDYQTGSGFNLGEWQARQRYLFGKGKLTQEKIDKLLAIGFGFDLAGDIGFRRGIDESIRYKAVAGTVNAPRNHITADGYRLGAWQHWQRKRHQSGSLDKLRQSELRKIGFAWSVKSGRRRKFDDMYSVALRHCRRHGDVNVPRSFVTSDGHKLGAWLDAQRSLHARGKLSAEKILRLEQLGIKWQRRPPSLKGDAGFEKGCLASLEHFEETGILLAGKDYVTTDGFRLGAWQSRQLRLARNDQLNPYRQVRLREIGFPM